MLDILNQDIQYMPGVGPKKKEIPQKELGIESISDLLEYYPYKYVDRTHIYSIVDMSGELPFIQIKGRILSFEELSSGRKKRLVAHFSDGTGVVDLVWFSGIKYATQQYKENIEYIVFGKPSVFNGRYQFAHPDIDKAADLQLSQMGMQPYYSTTEKMKKVGLTSRSIEKITKNILERMDQPLAETLPPFIAKRLRLVSRDTAMRNIHYPKNSTDLANAQQRLKFEELFYVQLTILRYAS